MGTKQSKQLPSSPQPGEEASSNQTPPPVPSSATSPDEEDPKPKGAKGEGASPKEGVRIHAINVGQGDCILVEFYNKTNGDIQGTGYYLIDGGHAHTHSKTYLKQYRESCLRKFNCWPTDTHSDTKLTGIVVTHPDKDHYGGIEHFLKTHKQYKGEVLITEQFSEDLNFTTTAKAVHGVENEIKIPSTEKLIIRGDRIQFYFNEKAGLYYKSSSSPHQIREAPFFPTSSTCETSDKNLSSIITTIDGTSVVLTGDTTSDVISKKLDLQGGVRVFQVPHHGSYNNSNRVFYGSFTADVYLISGGGHAGHDHPNDEVLRDIITVNTERKTNCIIVVTNSYGLRSEKLTREKRKRTRGKTKELNRLSSGWWNWVTIYHTDDLIHSRDTDNKERQSNQWVTLDPALCPPVPPQGRFNIPDNNLIEWSPRGYIEKIDPHCKMETVKPRHPFYYKCHVSIKDTQPSLTGTYMWEPDTIIAVPAPDQPWNGDTLNLRYVRESTFEQEKVKFLKPDKKLIHNETIFSQYTFQNPSTVVVDQGETQVEVKELLKAKPTIAANKNSEIRVNDMNIVTQEGCARGDIRVGDKIHAICANGEEIEENFSEYLSRNVTVETKLEIVYIKEEELATMRVAQ